MIRTEFKKLFNSYEFYIVFSISMILCLGRICEVCYDCYGVGIHKFITAFEASFFVYESPKIKSLDFFRIIFITTLPFLATLPYSDSYWVEKNNNINIYNMTRCKKSKYFFSKGIVIFFSGFIIAFIPLFLNFIAALVLCPLQFDYTNNLKFIRHYYKTNYFNILKINHPYIFIILHSIFISYLSGTFALMSYIVSFFNKINRLVVLGIPLVLCQLNFFITCIVGCENYSLVAYMDIDGIKFLKYSILNAYIIILLILPITAIMIKIFVIKDEV